jgi:Ig domain of plant-specific actin-binding protein
VLARIALAATALALLAAAPATAAGGTQFSTITGFTILSSGPFAQTQAGKLHPGVPASTCGTAKSTPAVDPGNFNYSALGSTSYINEPACVTVTYSTADASCQANGLFSALYIDDHDSAHVAQFYAGDVGSAPTDATPASYSVAVPGGKALTVVWNMSVAGTGCAAFDATLGSDRPWAFVPPPVTGDPFVGETLTANDTRWNGTPTFAHQWRRCAADGSSCADILGATAATYVPVPDDVGHAVRVHVSATEAAATSTADSDPVQIGIALDDSNGQSISLADPTQSGTLTRTAGRGSACGAKKAAPAGTDFANPRHYDLFRHTNASDSPVCALVSLEQTAACSSDRTFSVAYLPAFDPVAGVQKNYLADPAESGRIGPTTLRYGFDVPAGSAYDVVVTSFSPNATCPGYDLRFGTGSPYPTGTPSVEGTPQAGQTLTAAEGPWTGAPTFGYQWQRCFGDGSSCADIPGATARTLPLTARQVGDSFRVRVIATEGAGSASKLSGVSAAVAAAPPVPPPPPPPGPAPYAGIGLKGLAKVVGANGKVALTLQCPAEAVIGCAGTDAIRLGKATLGLQPFAMAPGKSAKLQFTLSKAVRKKLAKRRKLTAAQVVNSFDSRGVAVKRSAKLTLKAKPRKKRG